MAIDLSRETKRMRRLATAEVTRISDGLTTPALAGWVSKQFLAVLYDDPNGRRLSINRTNNVNPIGTPVRWGEGISWDQLMQVKSECGFGAMWAVEVDPPDDAVVNVANIRHLWLLETPPTYGWHPKP